ncbi:pyridoxamine 5'-phosphate oxidase family protein [Haloarchaeobius sp. DT45]|uniref:pyridoxamine 5'-phosphate oxidase family protein n=1 Tax=Haloarchaeobius sp. DT45 TaxID=3446116 RepID=UPI003F6B3D20
MTTVPPDIETRLTSEPPRVAYLSTCAGNRPHVAPVWYRYDDGVVEIVTTGRKLANIRENPRVSLAVSAETAGVPEWTVTLRGTATVVDDPAETEDVNARINRRYGMPADAWQENTLVRIAVGSASLRTY